jgi:tryptophan synthase beta chain
MYSYQQPDAAGHFGLYGGSFVSETLTHAIQELRHGVTVDGRINKQ